MLHLAPPPLAAAIADMWAKVIETEIGAALWAKKGSGRT